MTSQESTSADKSYQNAATILFVPSSARPGRKSTDDVSTPGAYFRLGGYSDIENDAKDPAVFYPRQHVTDAAAETVNQAAGADPAMHGIMFACSGRVLLRSAEKIYIHSADAIHIDTEKALTVLSGAKIAMTANDTITIKSGENKNLTISAGGGTGNVKTEALASVTYVNGQQYDYIYKDAFKYYQCNLYTYKLGGLVDVTMGGHFAFWMGSKLTITLSIDVNISVASSFSFWYFKFDMGVVKMDFGRTKLEFKDNVFSVSSMKTDNYALSCLGALYKTGAHGVESAAESIKSAATNVKTGFEALGAMSGGPSMYTMGIMGFL